MHSSLKLLIGIAALLLVALLGYGVLFALIRTNGTHAGEAGNSIAQEVERERQLKTLRAVLDDLATEEAELLSRVAEADDIVTLIQSIEDLSAVAGVDLTVRNARFEEAASDEAASSRQMAAELATIGSWNATTHFLLLLEMLPVRLYVSRVSFDTSSAPKGTDTAWNGLFSITVPTR